SEPRVAPCNASGHKALPQRRQGGHIALRCLAAEATARREQMADELASLPAGHVFNQNPVTSPCNEGRHNGSMLYARLSVMASPCSVNHVSIKSRTGVPSPLAILEKLVAASSSCVCSNSRASSAIWLRNSSS